jgi:hypothetical protein
MPWVDCDQQHLEPGNVPSHASDAGLCRMQGVFNLMGCLLQGVLPVVVRAPCVPLLRRLRCRYQEVGAPGS